MSDVGAPRCGAFRDDTKRWARSNSALWSLPVRAAYHLHQFRNLATLIGLVAGGDRVFHAMGDVITQNFFLDAAERGAHSRNLCDEVDAIAVFVDHLREAAHLAFDSAEPLLNG